MPTTSERNAAVDAIRALSVLPPTTTAVEMLQIADAVLSVAEAKPQFGIGTALSLVMNNSKDIQDIITKMGGIGNILSLAPAIFRIWNASLDTAQHAAAEGRDPRRALAAFHDSALHQEGGR